MKISTPIILISALLFIMPITVTAETEPQTGTVAETIDVGNYIYIRLEEPDMWIAAPPVAVSKGEQVEYIGGMEMRNFYSKSLDRTFESIWFIQNVRPAGRDMEQLHQGIAQNPDSAPSQIPKPVAVDSPAPGEITPLADGKSIADILSDSTGLKDQPVSLRAKVIKVSQNIMGKNWITLQDGSGSEPDSKLLATSSEMVAPGDLVVASGTIRNDIDLGSGYTYKVLLEETTFSQN
jgi:hypothetical protein